MMKCPYCECEMEEGIIESRSDLRWQKGLVRGIFWKSLDDVMLSKATLFTGGCAKAYYCSECSKIVMDVSDPKIDMNR